ncbi:MAG: hypothetical protein ACW98D_16830 [Promethearchaeota archaeon]|jgi:hypothetical protein
MALDLPHIMEYSVELGYGIIYLLLTVTTLLKYKKTKNKLALYFVIAFLILAISGLYGGTAGFLSKTGFETIPIFGNKINEIYEGLALGALIAFSIGLIVATYGS